MRAVEPNIHAFPMVRVPLALHRWFRSALRSAPSFALAVAGLLLALGGCEHTVALGTECPPIGKVCIDSTSRPPTDPPPGIDAGTAQPDAGGSVPEDGGAPLDAGDDVPDANLPPGPAFPGFRNPSFELTAGGPEGGNLNVLSPVEIDPWRPCGIGGIVGARPKDDLRNSPVGEPTEQDFVYPTDQSTLVSMSFGIGPGTLGQELSAPLQKGRTYAFTVDVVRSGEADARLQVWSSDGSCGPVARMVESEMIPEGRVLQPICLSFVPESDFTGLVLVMSPVMGARLFIDNLRPATACP